MERARMAFGLVWVAMIGVVGGCSPGEVRGGSGAIEDGSDAAPVCAAPDAPADVGPLPRDGFRLEATPLRAEVTRGGEVVIEVAVTRAAGFRTPVVVTAWGLPEGTTAEPIGVAEAVEHLVIEADGLAPDATEAAFAIHGSAGGRRDTLRATLSIVGPPVVEE